MLHDHEQAPHLKENLWGYAKRLDFVDEALRHAFPGRPRSAMTVLDIGCGNGSQLAIPLAEAGYQVTAVDPHDSSIEHGRRLSAAVSFLHGTIDVLPVRLFDCVILSEVLEHLHAPEDLLRLALSYMAQCGILIVTVPNGYGEFEVDRHFYQALHLDAVAGWLRSLRQPARPSAVASSDDESPHVQRFTLSALYALFDRQQLRVEHARGTSLLSGPIAAHLFARSATFVRCNALLADRLPLSFSSGWMFVLHCAHSKNA